MEAWRFCYAKKPSCSERSAVSVRPRPTAFIHAFFYFVKTSNHSLPGLPLQAHAADLHDPHGCGKCRELSGTIPAHGGTSAAGILPPLRTYVLISQSETKRIANEHMAVLPAAKKPFVNGVIRAKLVVMLDAAAFTFVGNKSE